MQRLATECDVASRLGSGVNSCESVWARRRYLMNTSSESRADDLAISAAVPLTDAQRAELQKRIEDDDAHPDDVMPWDQVKASTLALFLK